MMAQLPALKQGEKRPYVRKEEIIYYSKRYRIHNNYLAFGPSFLYSSTRDNSQKGIGIDFIFHIKNQHVNAGVMMSGEEFNSNNNVGAHLCYTLRKETKTRNYALFVGPAYNNGVLTIKDSTGKAVNAKYYQGFGVYLGAQAVIKFTYDFGFGAEVFSELGPNQKIAGFKIIAFFSSAYTGPSRTVNPNVRLESK